MKSRRFSVLLRKGGQWISREYQMLLRDETFLSSRLVKIPTPHFIVFYNGSEMKEDSCILKLSDSFLKPVENPELELTVQVLKIAPGRNEELLAACRTLWEYLIFVERVRLYAKTEPLNEAVERAVNECIEEGILEDFLRKNKAEVIAMCIFEYDEERELQKIRKAEYEVGRESGIREGLEIGRQEGLKLGVCKGCDIGKQDLLKSLIQKKLAKGKSPALIAEELEEDLAVIEDLIQSLNGCSKQ